MALLMSFLQTATFKDQVGMTQWHSQISD